VSPSVLPLVSPCYKSISVFGYSLCCYKRRKSRDGGRSTNGRHASLSPHILYMNFDDNEEGIENTVYLGMMGLDSFRCVLAQCQAFNCKLGTVYASLLNSIIKQI